MAHLLIPSWDATGWNCLTHLIAPWKGPHKLKSLFRDNIHQCKSCWSILVPIRHLHCRSYRCPIRGIMHRNRNLLGEKPLSAPFNKKNVLNISKLFVSVGPTNKLPFDLFSGYNLVPGVYFFHIERLGIINTPERCIWKWSATYPHNHLYFCCHNFTTFEQLIDWSFCFWCIEFHCDE